jgi:cell division septum initiation protein DivIVA
MKCGTCGAEPSAGDVYCRMCGHSVSPAPPDSVDRLVADAARAAKDLASTALKLSHRVLDKAEAAAHDPRGAVRTAVKRVSDELDAARKDLDKALDRLK